MDRDSPSLMYRYLLPHKDIPIIPLPNKDKYTCHICLCFWLYTRIDLLERGCRGGEQFFMIKQKILGNNFTVVYNSKLPKQYLVN